MCNALFNLFGKFQLPGSPALAQDAILDAELAEAEAADDDTLLRLSPADVTALLHGNYLAGQRSRTLAEVNITLCCISRLNTNTQPSQLVTNASGETWPSLDVALAARCFTIT